MLSFPYSVIKKQVKGVPLGVTANIIARFLRSRGCRVNVTESGLDVSGLGHAGVCIIDRQTSAAYYYEYGCYDERGWGVVRESNLFNNPYLLSFDGKHPEQSAFEKLCDNLTVTNSPTSPRSSRDRTVAAPTKIPFESVYVKTKCGTGETMVKHAKGQIPNGRPRYDLTNNHCGSFALEVASIGGVDVSAARKATGFEFTPEDEEIIKDAIEQYDVAWYKKMGSSQGGIRRRKERATRKAIAMAREAISKIQIPVFQIRALQKEYNILNYFPMDFEGFPKSLYKTKKLVQKR